MWIVKTKQGKLRLCTFKPRRFDNHQWIYDGTKADVMNLPKEMFPDLKWEDDPVEVMIVTTVTSDDMKKYIGLMAPSC